MFFNYKLVFVKNNYKFMGTRLNIIGWLALIWTLAVEGYKVKDFPENQIKKDSVKYFKKHLETTQYSKLISEFKKECDKGHTSNNTEIDFILSKINRILRKTKAIRADGVISTDPIWDAKDFLGDLLLEREKEYNTSKWEKFSTISSWNCDYPESIDLMNSERKYVWEKDLGNERNSPSDILKDIADDIAFYYNKINWRVNITFETKK